MDGRDLQAGCERTMQRLPVWIIEHVWTHKIMDVREVVDSSSWPDVDSQPLSLEDSWRLRVTAARVYSIMKSRDVQNFGKILGFLETTRRLLPRLVPAIKHMKIMFGVKTMIIMWMLKEHKGIVETVTQILRFFPHKLPQYQDQCSPREMFIMRKNHVDFRNLAQALAIDKERLEDYIKTQMERQYGERYAQKVEERLLLYLHLLEAELPGETYIDKIMRKESPVTAEEKLLLELISSTSDRTAAGLRRLLLCDAAGCRPADRQTEGSSEPSLCGSSSLPNCGEVLRSSTDPDQDQNRSCDEGRSGEAGTRSSPPQFCSRHQRWVRSILRGCPDESSEDQQNRTRTSSSPLLFWSSSSSSSSQDLTPSDLLPRPPQKPLPQTSPPTAAEPEDPNSSGDTAPPSLRLPVIRLVDVATVCSSCSAEPLVLLGGKRSSSHQGLTSQSTEPVPHMQTAAGSQPGSAAGSQPGSAGFQPGSAAGSQPSSAGSQPGSAGFQPGSAGSQPGSAGFQPGSAGSQPGSAAGSQPGSAGSMPSSAAGSQPGSAGSQPGSAAGSQPGSAGSMPSSAAGSQPGSAGSKPGSAGSKPSSAAGSQPGSAGFQPGSAAGSQPGSAGSKPGSAPADLQPPAKKTFSKLSRRFRRAADVDVPPASKSFICPSNLDLLSSQSFPKAVQHEPVRRHRQTQRTKRLTSRFTPTSSSISSSSGAAAHRNQPSSRAAELRSGPLRSNPLQPAVTLIRLSIEECQRLTRRTAAAALEDAPKQGSGVEEEPTETSGSSASSFDVNVLYSTGSSDSEDSSHSDPSYRPHVKKESFLRV